MRLILSVILVVVVTLLLPIHAKSTPSPTPSPFANKQILLVQSNHLDVGFDGIHPSLGYAKNVVDKYFTEYFPKAVALGNLCRNMTYLNSLPNYHKLSSRSLPLKSRWMTQSWLISLYIDCPVGMGFTCPSAEQVAAFKDSVRLGDITWHAFPFNSELETIDQSLFEFGIHLSQDLNHILSPPRPYAHVLSQRDVPGMSKNVITTLVKHKVIGVTVGVNGATPPPSVPRNTVFRWRDTVTQSEVLATWHGGGYGGYLPSDAVVVPGFDYILVTDWRGDNAGPATDVNTLIETFLSIETQYPDAKSITSSTFDDYFELLANASTSVLSSLLVVEAEVGDTWIYGVPSDPFKNSMGRGMMRARGKCMMDNVPECSFENYQFYNMSRLLLKYSEHTWLDNG